MLPDLYISRFRGSGARSLLNRATRQRHDDCVTTTQESYRRPARRHTARRPESRLPPTFGRIPGRRPLSSPARTGENLIRSPPGVQAGDATETLNGARGGASDVLFTTNITDDRQRLAPGRRDRLC